MWKHFDISAMAESPITAEMVLRGVKPYGGIRFALLQLLVPYPLSNLNLLKALSLLNFPGFFAEFFHPC